MKTLIKNDAHVKNKIKAERRKLSNSAKTANSNHTGAVGIQLKFEDYQDLIEIKNHRAEKLNNQRPMFFLIGLTIVLLFVNVVFNWNFYDDSMVDDLGQLNNADFEEILDVPNTEQPPPPPPKILKQPIIVEVPDEEVLEEVDIEIDVEVTEEMTVEQVVFEEVPEETAEEIFQIVETSPEPIGGYKAFYKYVGENLKYPNEALRMNIAGKVFVRFVVDKKGNIKDVEAVKGIGGRCDEEAVRIIENAPKWKPGRQRGRAVNVFMMLPITFRLE